MYAGDCCYSLHVRCWQLSNKSSPTTFSRSHYQVDHICRVLVVNLSHEHKARSSRQLAELVIVNSDELTKKIDSKTNPNQIVHQFMPKRKMPIDERVKHTRLDFGLVREQRVQYHGKEYVDMLQLDECRELLENPFRSKQNAAV